MRPVIIANNDCHNFNFNNLIVKMCGTVINAGNGYYKIIVNE